MATERVMDGWECGMCFEPIGGQLHIRIAADIAVERDLGGVASVMDDEVMIMAIFHKLCVTETLDDEALEEDVPHLREARALIETLRSKKTKKTQPPKTKSRRSANHLRVLNGGTR